MTNKPVQLWFYALFVDDDDVFGTFQLVPVTYDSLDEESFATMITMDAGSWFNA